MSSLFIGLGGVGTGTLECLSKKMNEYNDSLSARGLKPAEAYYYYIDTFDGLKRDNPHLFGSGTGKFFQTIGDKSPDSILAGLRGTLMDNSGEWYDAPSKKTNLIDGADATRQYSRLALKEDWGIIQPQLRKLVDLVSKEGKGRIYVVTGSCGGTGCGIYMDLLYMINNLYSDKTTSSNEFDVRLIMAMPHGYIPEKDPREDKLTHKAMLNAYATLAELNAVCKDTYSVDAKGDKVSSLFSVCNVNKKETKENWSFSPFKYAYLYESAGQERDVVSQKISDFLFEIDLAGNDSDSFDEILTNVNSQWKDTANLPYTNAFSSIGQYTIEKSDDIMRKYMKERLLYEAFHKGLIDSEIYKEDTSLVAIEGAKLQQEIVTAIETAFEEIERNVTNDALKNEALGDTVYRVFTSSPDVRNELTKVVLDQKAILLDKVKRTTYNKCREWLKQYDFTTVFKIVDKMDVDLYGIAITANKSIGEMIDNAKAKSKSGMWKRWKPENATKQFKELLKIWLTYEVNKALTASEKDIAIDNKGYLDHCKTFITDAKHTLIMPKEKEEWESEFKKRVNEYKCNNDRCYLPDLNEIMDENNNIRPESPMVHLYEDELVVSENKADLNEGTCSINMLHEAIFKKMSSDKELELYGIVLDKLFDPTPGSNNSLRSSDKVPRFVEEYLKAAEGIIDDLIKTNNAIKDAFKTDIVNRLASKSPKDRATVCDKFKKYDNVELRTVDMTKGALTTVNVYISNFHGNDAIMKQLEAVKGDRSVVVDDAFCSDRILKLIVKSGYSIDKYRHYEDYMKYAKEQMTKEQSHDPFIDKRFRGSLVDGKYDLDVYKALRGIADVEKADEFSLDGCDESELYVAAASIMYQYFNHLNKKKLIKDDFKGGITIKNTEITLKKYKYNRAAKRYVAEADVDKIDLKKKYGVNDFVSFDMWIDYLMGMKDKILDENKLVTDAFGFLMDKGIKYSDLLDEKVANMIGGEEDAKPKYDFLRAYQNWLKNYNS